MDVCYSFGGFRSQRMHKNRVLFMRNKLECCGAAVNASKSIKARTKHDARYHRTAPPSYNKLILVFACHSNHCHQSGGFAVKVRERRLNCSSIPGTILCIYATGSCRWPLTPLVAVARRLEFLHAHSQVVRLRTSTIRVVYFVSSLLQSPVASHFQARKRKRRIRSKCSSAESIFIMST